MNKAVSIQDVMIVINTQDHDATILSPEFLKYSGIVPPDWELAQQPIRSPQTSQVVYQNAINIAAQRNSVIFQEILSSKPLESVTVASIAHRYIAALPQVNYQKVEINLRGLMTFNEGEDTAHAYMSKTLLTPGSWQEFGEEPVRAAVQLAYTLSRCQLNLTVSEASLRVEGQPSLSTLFFGGSFSYSLVGETQSEHLQQLNQIIGNWLVDLETFQELVNQRFLQL